MRPLNDKPHTICAFSAAVLVVLRLVLGWHFTMEGAKKLQDPKFSAAPFLRAAKGPLAPFYHAQLGDAYGEQRLNIKNSQAYYKEFADEAAVHYGYSESQKKKAKSLAEQRGEELEQLLDPEPGAWSEFYFAWETLQDHRADAKRQSVPLFKERDDEKEKELRAKLNAYLAGSDKITAGLEDDLFALADADQQTEGELRMPNVAGTSMDGVIPWFLLIVGVMLLAGLLTPLAAAGGALFLLSVIGTQPPWVPGADPTYYQSVEVMALLTVAVTLAGRYAGLDYFVGYLFGRCCQASPAPSPTAAAR